jgi:DNA-binding NarL/FixJ family response regulator
MSAAVTTQLLSYAVNHQATAFPRLSPREGDVFHHLTNGKPNRAISQLLNMSERTVRFHVQNIYDKLGVRRRSEAIALGMQQRLEVKRGSDCER